MNAAESGATITIVALGDSTTAGTPAYQSPIEAPPHGAGEVTSQFCWWMMQAEPTWRVLNRGVNRERTEAIAARFDRDVLDAAPRALILLAGVNDIYDGDAAADVQARLAAMYGRARRAALPVVACSILPFDTATDDQARRLREVNAWIHATATTTAGLAWCDTAAAAAMPGRPSQLLGSPDGRHPGIEGHRRMAEALVPVTRALIATH